ncbi:MAG TPA: L-seryl-tRNA(Sec) selenium transferase [Dehalococcoidia bacterium]|nr:L-seryl-tRNA(Sec) selenium transferase [Dehalococcoidia bacterium]
MASPRDLPSVDRLLALPPLSGVPAGPLRTAAARQAVAEARAALLAGRPAPSPESLAGRGAELLERLRAPSLLAVINASGVILHTNLGRAPLSPSAIAAMQAVAAGYSNLEFDLAEGERGSRLSHLEQPLRAVTGAEAGIAVNNNASALLLMLSALCQGREVIVSRGQAVEIGGGFRIPDVLRQSGATLIEVGTTNRTYLRDFAEAVSERTAALLRVHSSNFRVIGFTAFPSIGELAQLARERGVLLLDDLGSGCLLDTRPFGLLPEPTVQASIAGGVDLAAFSGDKLLGGPQAGIIVGRQELVSQLRRHPLARALRMDKTSIAALAATLQHYLAGEALEQIPAWRMIAAPAAGIAARAATWGELCPLPCQVLPSRTMIGGGSLPEEGVATAVLAIDDASPQLLAARLRRQAPPIIARIEEGRLLLDPRTVLPEQDSAVADALARLSASAPATASS